MSATDTRITNSVQIESDSKQRVAFDLATRISNNETAELKRNPREYHLKLYLECLNAVNGYDQEE